MLILKVLMFKKYNNYKVFQFICFCAILIAQEHVTRVDCEKNLITV